MTGSSLQSIVLLLSLTALVRSCRSTQKAESLAEAKSSAERSTWQKPHLSDEPTSENDEHLRRGLAKYPRADINGNGVLTMSEIRAYMAKQRQASKRRRTAGLAADLRGVLRTGNT